MIQYTCDLCGEFSNKKDLSIIDSFPRRIAFSTVDVMGRKMTSFEDVGTGETHLCASCCKKIAYMFPVIEMGLGE